MVTRERRALLQLQQRSSSESSGRALRQETALGRQRPRAGELGQPRRAAAHGARRYESARAALPSWELHRRIALLAADELEELHGPGGDELRRTIFVAAAGNTARMLGRLGRVPITWTLTSGQDERGAAKERYRQGPDCERGRKMSPRGARGLEAGMPPRIESVSYRVQGELLRPGS